MKVPLLLFLCSLLNLTNFAQEPIQPKSDITEVTVFLRSAQITRSSRVTLRKGDNILRFAGLAKGIDPRSVQATAPKDILINSVSHEVNHLKGQKKPRRILNMEDSLRIIDEALALNKAEKSVLDQERTMLLQNQDLAGKQKGVSITELERAADFFRTRLRDIHGRLMTLATKKTDLIQRKNRINKQLKAWNYERNQPSNDILVVLKTEAPTTAKISFRYLVQDAGWIPGYDLRVKDTDSPIQLDYNADVYQKTGVDWKDVKLTLSSGNPNQSGTKPTLSQWNLYTSAPVTRGVRGSYKEQGYLYDRNAEKTEPNVFTPNADGVNDEFGFDDIKTLADYTQVVEGATTAEFRISIRQNIPADGQKHQVSIQSDELPASYEHFAIPKLDKDAFLVAGVTDWEALNLLPGMVNIFFEGTYITAAALNPNYTADTLDFSLGRDKKVIIKRELLKDFNKRKTIGFNRERTFGYEFSIRNTKSSAVTLQLQDQIPVSQDEDITVKLIEKSGASHDEETGKLTWNIRLAPGKTEKIRLVFSVKHPKKKNVPGI